jgi:predicted phage tail protein
MLVYGVIGLLIFTKLLDVLTTLGRIRQADTETNPFARGLMQRLGTHRTVWLVFILAGAIIAVAGFAALRGGALMRIVFIIAGFLMAIIQAAVAHANWTGTDNLITRKVRALYALLSRRP